eukprot:comp16699_c0_seq1/m.14958 comp16699_c0_seq1/g.14958  ORF comp16699_c0_seq1/g.14958 comp16699_c0_seq1/m.14958 type:complete len:396 (-) comp16699_c0_seq1:200-1387(-)
MMNGTLDEQERVAKRIRTCKTKTLADLDKAIRTLQEASERLKQDGASQSSPMDVDGEGPKPNRMLQAELTLLQKRVKPTLTQLPANHKEGYASISKLGKTIDKLFQTNIERVSNPDAFAGKEDLLNQTVAQHLFRQGRFAIGEVFVKEAHVAMDSDQQEPFRDMYVILEAIKQHDLGPALTWVVQHSSELSAMGSDLEFQLHRLHFARLVADSQRDQALAYARTHFPKFSSQHMKQIQHLMGTFAYIGRLEVSPYSSLLAPTNWADVAHTFTGTCCQLLGLPTESALHAGVTVGTKALPTLLKMANVMQNKKEGLWSQKDELPVEINIGREHQYHSIFSCPVSREQTTDENPAMFLPCGHVIAKASLQKISKGNKFKCPYCPSEQTPSQARQMHF